MKSILITFFERVENLTNALNVSFIQISLLLLFRLQWHDSNWIKPGFNLSFWSCYENFCHWIILSQPCVGWLIMKICSPTNCPSPLDNIFLTVTKNKFLVWNYSFSGTTRIYLFELRNYNSRTKCKICLKLTTETPEGCQWYGWRPSAAFIVIF